MLHMASRLLVQIELTPPMKRIVQQHTNGCVPACIAMLSGVSYLQAVRIVYPHRLSGNPLGAYYDDVIRAIKAVGLRFYTRSRIIPFEQLRHNALITIDHPIYGETDHHAVIWDKEAQRIIDPYPKPGRKPGRHLPQSSYQKHAIEMIEVY
jgi:hypothetical protein